MANEQDEIKDPRQEFELGEAVVTPAGIGVITGMVDRNGEIGLVVSISSIFMSGQVEHFEGSGLRMREAAEMATAASPTIRAAKEPWSQGNPLQGIEAL